MSVVAAHHYILLNKVLSHVCLFTMNSKATARIFDLMLFLPVDRVTLEEGIRL